MRSPKIDLPQALPQTLLGQCALVAALLALLLLGAVWDAVAEDPPGTTPELD